MTDNDDRNRCKNVLLITNIPTPYRIPLFNELSRQLSNIGITLTVAFAALGYRRRKWDIEMSDCDFAYKVLSRETASTSAGSFKYKGLSKLIRDLDPILSIGNGFSKATLYLYLRNILFSEKFAIWSGTISRRGVKDSFLRIFYRKILIQRASRFIAYGKRSKGYLVRLGAENESIHIAINTVDTQYFTENSSKIQLKGTAQESTQHITYIGNLERGKRLDLLIHAAAQLRKTHRNFVVDIIGSGSQENELAALVKEFQLSDIVTFHGFKQRPELIQFLDRSICFAFPSEYDIYGLVLVESMACGIPCVSSIHAGASDDLIIDNETGFLVDYENTSEVVERLKWILNNPEQTRKIGIRARDFITNRINLKQSAKGFLEAITSLEAGKSKTVFSVTAQQ